MFSVDASNVKKYERDLKVFAKRAYPFATKTTVNRAAFDAQRNAREGVRDDMVLRNRFTVQSVQVGQTRTLQVSRQRALVGSSAEYMADQEFGAIKAKRGKEGVSIATGYSAGQQGEQPRTRLPRKANKMANIQLQRRRKRGGTKRQQNLIAIKEAAKSGRKYVFLDLGRSKGIFKVIGGARRPKIKMVHDLTRDSVVIPRNPWLAPAVRKTEDKIPKFYEEALVFQLKRRGLFD
jgi:hypothetical protein